MGKFILLVSALLLLSASQNARAQVQYTVTDLGTLRVGSVSHASGINNSGQVVGGSATIGNSYPHAFLYIGGSMTYVGSTDPLAKSVAWGINNVGQVVGETGSTGLGGGGQAFLYSGGSLQVIATASGGDSSIATGINDSGQVAGFAFNSGNSSYDAFLFSGGSMQDLGAGPSPYNFGSFAYGINNSGQVVGEFSTGSSYPSGFGTRHAFLYSGGSMLDLGTLSGGTSSDANGINNLGQVVGWADVGSGAWHAFLYDGGTMQDLGTLSGDDSSVAQAINDRGQVVGYAYNSTGSSAPHAFLYSGGSMMDLNNLIVPGSGWTLEEATGINDSGQICGYGMSPPVYGVVEEHAFLLTPTPEPSTFVLLGAGAIGLLAYTWRRRALRPLGAALMLITLSPRKTNGTRPPTTARR